MFNFTTQTVFNTIITTTEAKVRTKTADKGYNIITKSGDNGPELRIGNTRFNQANVLDIQKKTWSKENLAKVEFDISKVITLVTADEKGVQEGSYRIILYVGLSMNSQDSFYANDFVYKGKPLFIEFPIKASDSAADVAKRVVKIANKYMLFVAQDKIIDVRADGTKVVFEGINGYQLFKKAILQKYDPEAAVIDCCNSNGEFIDIMHGVPVVYSVKDGEVVVGDQVLEFDGLRKLEDNEVAIEPGLEAFCDYDWLIHNLRLPTLANTYFWAVNKAEMPIPGGKYVQYIVRICAERDGIGGEVVGQRTKSVTTHVFYVLDQGSNISKFETELKKVLPQGESDFKTDAEDTLANPFRLESSEGEGGNG